MVWLGVASAIVLIFAMAIRRVFSQQNKRALEFVEISSALLLAVSLLISAATISETLINFYLPTIFLSPWAAVGSFVAGLLLFALRKKYLGIYGIIEVVGAIVTTIICAITVYGSSVERAAALLGATYFLIRGLDNVDKGNVVPTVAAWIEYRRYIDYKGALAVAVGVLAFAVSTIREEDMVQPPYLVDIRSGARTPVPATMCGRAFIVCDRAAWRESNRLKAASVAAHQPDLAAKE